MKTKKSKFKTVEEKLDSTDEKLCEFKSVLDLIKEQVEEMISDEVCPDEVQGNKHAQSIIQEMISKMVLIKGKQKGEK